MENERKGIKNSGAWVGVGTAIGAAIYAITNEPTWIASFLGLQLVQHF